MEAGGRTLGRSEGDADFFGVEEKRSRVGMGGFQMRTKSKRKAVRKAVPAPEVRVGAARALERLETEEGVLYSTYKSARASGDALTAKVARDGWLKVSESLRKYDLMVASSRRGEGELIPRAQVASQLGHFASWIYFSLIVATGSADKAWSSFSSALSAYVQGSTSCGAKVPVWMAKALLADHLSRNPQEALTAWRRVHHTATAASLHPDDPKKFREYIETSMKTDEAELKGNAI